jgi:O-antigen ligase
LNAALAYFPVGSGFGSFDAVFRHFEPQSNLGPSYFNHAHNDFVEIVLEGGIATLAILATFLGWFSWRAWTICRSKTSRMDSELLMARAAVFGCVILGASSFVDYPLRTPLLAAIFALLCGMIEWPQRNRETTTGSVQSSLPEVREQA